MKSLLSVQGSLTLSPDDLWNLIKTEINGLK